MKRTFETPIYRSSSSNNNLQSIPKRKKIMNYNIMLTFCLLITLIASLFITWLVIPPKKTQSGIAYEKTNLEQLSVITDYDRSKIIYLYRSKVDGVEIAITDLN